MGKSHRKRPAEVADEHTKRRWLVFFPPVFVEMNVLLSAAKRAHLPPCLGRAVGLYVTFVSCCVHV